jgi:hypothetical protein
MPSNANAITGAIHLSYGVFISYGYLDISLGTGVFPRSMISLASFIKCQDATDMSGLGKCQTSDLWK